MSSRPAEEGGVLSFTFLDVLTCTMGTLVLLLVVFGERAKQALVAEARARREAVAATAADPPIDAAAGTPEQLAALERRQAELDEARARAAEMLRDEQDRVTHLEDHERRLEHQLAELHFTLERLEEAEKQQRVDQETAKRELARLTELISDAEKQIDDLRKNGTKQRSYAIVPYKGANGTTRRPIYIECTADAVTIQPEGIRLAAADFDGPIRSGNPLAAAVRAAREELNARAIAVGGDAAELPDPYPLLIVRPGGATAYAVALSAISAWDADFGYEFVEADWKLEFPAIDPKLGQVMTHAVDQARQRQALLAKVAPRRYGSRLVRGGSGPGGGGLGEGDGESDGFETLAYGGGDRIGGQSANGSLADGEGLAASNSGSRTASAGMGEFQRGGQGSGSGGSGGAGGAGGASTGGTFAEEFAGAPAGGTSSSSGAAGGSPGGSPPGTTAQAGGATGGAAGSSAIASAPGGQPGANSPSSTGASAPPPVDVHAAGTLASTDAPATGPAGDQANASGATSQPSGPRSMAETRGSNWANLAATQRASAVTRPIRVVVGVDEMKFMPEGGGDPAEAESVSFHQSTDKVMDGLAANVQKRIDEWGLAGRSMYWRPTLVLQVAPGAERQAERIVELLEDSGVDARLPDGAPRVAEGPLHAR
jgi:TolA-binding protein